LVEDIIDEEFGFPFIVFGYDLSDTPAYNVGVLLISECQGFLIEIQLTIEIKI
jgi:hypothetical protein